MKALKSRAESIACNSDIYSDIGVINFVECPTIKTKQFYVSLIDQTTFGRWQGQLPPVLDNMLDELASGWRC